MSNIGPPIDTRFFAPRTPVALLDVGATSEALLLRALLENLGTVVTFHQPGTPEDFLLVLGQGDVAPRFLIICGHGDGEGLIFGEYASGIDTSALVAGRMPASSIAPRIALPGRIVLSTACMTGTRDWGEAFLSGGVRAYIAPDGYPEGTDTILFAHLLFYQILARQADVETAWQHATSYAPAMKTFAMHRPSAQS